jgi:hypothetical protein
MTVRKRYTLSTFAWIGFQNPDLRAIRRKHPVGARADHVANSEELMPPAPERIEARKHLGTDLTPDSSPVSRAAVE